MLVGAYGVKPGGPFDRDIADFWCLHPSEVLKLKWHDPEKGKRDFPSMPEEKLTIVARNVNPRRACWEPFMHNPKLKWRLHRIKVPTRLIWGEHDGIVTPAYGKLTQMPFPGRSCRSSARDISAARTTRNIHGSTARVLCASRKPWKK